MIRAVFQSHCHCRAENGGQGLSANQGDQWEKVQFPMPERTETLGWREMDTFQNKVNRRI